MIRPPLCVFRFALCALCLLALAGGCNSSNQPSTAGQPLAARDAEDVRALAAIATYAAVRAVPERDQVRYASLARAIATDVKSLADGDGPAVGSTADAVTLDSVRDYVLGRVSHAAGTGGADAVFLIDQLLGIARRRLPVVDSSTQPVADALTRSAIRAIADGVLDGVAPVARSNP